MRRPAAALLLLGLPAAAWTEDAPKAALALVPAPGKPVWFVHRHATTQDLTLGKSTLHTEASGTSELAVEILEREAGGTYRALLRIGRLQLKADSPVLKIDADSAKPLPTSNVARVTALAAVACADSEFRATLDAGGAVTKIEGVDAARDAVMKRWDLAEPFRDVVDASLTEEKVRQIFGWALLATPLPRGEVGVGHAWDDADVLPGTADGMVLTAKRRLELTEIAADAVRIGGKGTVDVAGARVEGAVDKRSDVAAEARLSRTDALPLATKETATFSLTLPTPRGDIPMKQTTTSSLVRVPTWPSREKPAAETPK